MFPPGLARLATDPEPTGSSSNPMTMGVVIFAALQTRVTVGPAETITLRHTARDRTAFARGALAAAKWIRGRRGWFTMKDVLGIA